MWARLWRYFLGGTETENETSDATTVARVEKDLESGKFVQDAPLLSQAPAQRAVRAATPIASRIKYKNPFEAHSILYRKEYEVRVCRAIKNTGRNGTGGRQQQQSLSAALMCVDEGTDAVKLNSLRNQMRDVDERDLVIDFRSVINAANIVRLKDENKTEPTFYLIDGGNRALVVEVALVIQDELWLSGQVFVRAHTSQIAPLQQSTHIFGDFEGVMLSFTGTSEIPLKDNGEDGSALRDVAGKHCKLNRAARSVDGWCLQCGLQPNMLTLYQSPLPDTDLVKYAEEICTPGGTHEHVQRVTDDLENSMEVRHASTIARDLHEKRGASAVVVPAQSNDNDGASEDTLFVNRYAWCDEVALARHRVLKNLPLTDLTNAQIHIRARGTDNVADRTLRVIVAVQCIEFVRV